MNAVYCEKCGFGNEYGLKKPKFCGECAHEIGSMFRSDSSKATNSSKKEDFAIESEDDEPEYAEEYKSLGALRSLMQGSKIEVSFANENCLESVDVK